MTLIEAINSIDEFKPNGYTQENKISWLSDLDGMIKKTVIDTHFYNDDEEEIEFDGYDEDTPHDTELIVKFPFESIYLYWLEAKIDYYNGEIARYNNSILMFSDMFNQWKNDYNASHSPKSLSGSGKIRYF